MYETELFCVVWFLVFNATFNNISVMVVHETKLLCAYA